MDLMDLTPSSDTVEVTLFHPNTLETLANDDGSDMTVTMYAPHSKEYKEVMHEQTNRRLKATQAKKKIEFTSQDLEQSTLDLLVKTTKDWNITFSGEQPKFTQAAAKEIYTKVFWLREQLEEAVNNSLDFTKG